ncbi:MAG: cupredoxin domain-containing protein [Polyangiales bacterium]
MTFRALLALPLALLSFGSLSCSSSADAPAPADLTIQVGNNYFKPQIATIKKGQTVEWVWVEGAHDVTSGTKSGSTCTPDGKFSSGDPQSGGTWRKTFDTAGVFPYFCTPHCNLNQTGTLTVQ